MCRNLGRARQSLIDFWGRMHPHKIGQNCISSDFFFRLTSPIFVSRPRQAITPLRFKAAPSWLPCSIFGPSQMRAKFATRRILFVKVVEATQQEIMECAMIRILLGWFVVLKVINKTNNNHIKIRDNYDDLDDDETALRFFIYRASKADLAVLPLT